jgi:hypothetical protein
VEQPAMNGRKVFIGALEPSVRSLEQPLGRQGVTPTGFSERLSTMASQLLGPQLDETNAARQKRTGGWKRGPPPSSKPTSTPGIVPMKWQRRHARDETADL